MLKGNLVAYSGMTTKIRAMKNKLLSPEQYEEITHFTTVAELISFLQTTPAYGEVLASMDPALAHRGEVESRMTFSTYSDFSKIYHFAGNSQKKYLEYYFMKYEISILKACMRNIMDSRSNANPVLTDKHFKRHTKINIDKLVLSNTIEEFVDNLSGTLYEKPLREVLKLDNPVLFDFEMNLDLFFFSYIWNHPDYFVPKGERQYFKKSFGPHIDLLNMLWIYRCKNYYVLSDAQIYSFLIPVNYYLDKNEIKRMVEAENNTVLYEIISNSYYGKTYGFDSTKNMEAQFSDILDTINMKDFKDAPYSLAAINAYFHLKNMEVARVVTALECIRYGYKPEAISQYINQKRGVL